MEDPGFSSHSDVSWGLTAESLSLCPKFSVRRRRLLCAEWDVRDAAEMQEPVLAVHLQKVRPPESRRLFSLEEPV